MALSLNQFLVLYTWFPLAILLFLLLLIARFYERFSQARTLFRLFMLPIVLFGMAAVRYASLDRPGPDLVADVISGLAGVILIFLCLRLYGLMIWQVKGQDLDEDHGQ